MTEYTPSLEEVRDATSLFRSRFFDHEEFNRWLTAEMAAAEQRGAKRAFKESANEMRREMRWQYEQNINGRGDSVGSIDRLGELESVFKYRADRVAD